MTTVACQGKYPPIRPDIHDRFKTVMARAIAQEEADVKVWTKKAGYDAAMPLKSLRGTHDPEDV